MASKTGRTPAVIDWDTVGKLLEADCKTVDIARQLGVSEMTLYRRCKSDLNVSYVTFSQQKKMLGDNLLRDDPIRNLTPIMDVIRYRDEDWQ